MQICHADLIYIGQNTGRRYEFFYASKYSTAVTEPTFTNPTITWYIIMNISCTELFPNLKQVYEIWAKFHRHPQEKYDFHYTEYYKTRRSSVVLGSDLYRISPQIGQKKSGEYAQKFIYAVSKPWLLLSQLQISRLLDNLYRTPIPNFTNIQ